MCERTGALHALKQNGVVRHDFITLRAQLEARQDHEKARLVAVVAQVDADVLHVRSRLVGANREKLVGVVVLQLHDLAVLDRLARLAALLVGILAGVGLGLADKVLMILVVLQI